MSNTRQACEPTVRSYWVTQTALEVGYSTPSAFVTAFKRELGQTPGHYGR